VTRVVRAGRVLKNVDPDKAGGVTVQVPEVLATGALGGDERFVPGRFPFAGKGEGFFFPPQPGAALELELEQGDAVEDVIARWVGMVYTDTDQIPAEFRSSYPNRGGIKFGSETLLFDRTKRLLALVAQTTVALGKEGATEPAVLGAVLVTYLNALTLYLTTALGAIAGPPPPVPATLLSTIVKVSE
jgi:hypothetical protein